MAIQLADSPSHGMPARQGDNPRKGDTVPLPSELEKGRPPHLGPQVWALLGGACDRERFPVVRLWESVCSDCCDRPACPPGPAPFHLPTGPLLSPDPSPRLPLKVSAPCASVQPSDCHPTPPVTAPAAPQCNLSRLPAVSGVGAAGR